jgi:glycogen debranching enzyme
VSRRYQKNTVMPDQRGLYFTNASGNPAPVSTYAELSGKLPSPIFEENNGWVAMYWKAWELAARNFNEPKPGSGFVSPFIDAAFNENIFLWDTCFMTMFCNVAHPLVPGIQSLDNFYARQHASGEISREIVRATGEDYGAWVNREGAPLYSSHGWAVPAIGRSPVTFVGRAIPQPPSNLTVDALNNPLCAWAEMESYRVTGDAARIAAVYPPLVRYFAALKHYLRQGNGLYLTDWASMDNSPRNRHLEGGGCAVDTSSQMVLFARCLADMAELQGKEAERQAWSDEGHELAQLINEHLWDAGTGFYYDLTLDGRRVPVKTVAAFWTLLAGVAAPHQVAALGAELQNPATFRRHHRVPTLAADQAGYDPAGGYWCGAVWAPTTTMVIRGLERCGCHDLARTIAMDDLTVTGHVFEKTGTVWENYAPDADEPGRPAQPDFVGWTGIVPILFFLEFAIGLKPDAVKNTLTWQLNTARKTGCERYRFNGRTVSLCAEPVGVKGDTSRITIHADKEFTLIIKRENAVKTVVVRPGGQDFVF